MKRVLLVCILATALAFMSCSGKKAEEMYETAQFEELQKNYVHARQLYQDIIKKYPDSDYSKKASDRLTALKGKD
ncbi:MAG: hypothetical protein JRJ85_05560 [Deltaproteobacteria bacterium]|nr:hypothetical protein [Deltaproteobacteria bacterium]